MSDASGGSVKTTLDVSPRGRCRACGYPVHADAGFTCPECGSDLRQTGIVTSDVPRYAGLKRVLWFLLFAAPWAWVCLFSAHLAHERIVERTWPIHFEYRFTYRLYPRDAQYDYIEMVQNIQGVLRGTLARDLPLKEQAGDLRYEVTATLNSSQGACVLHVYPLADMSWRRIGGGGGDARGDQMGQSALNDAVLRDWLRAAGRDTTQASAALELAELQFIFDQLKVEVEGGHDVGRIALEKGIARAVGWWNPAAFNGFEISRYQSANAAGPPEGWALLCGAVPWAGGVWWWLRRGRSRHAGKPSVTTSPSVGGSIEVSHRLLSILFSDVKDYTSRSAAEPRAGVIEIVRSHRQRVFPAVERHHGKIVKQMGDGILCTFDGATDAVLAGLEIQRGSARENADGKPLEIRIGISTGEVTVEDGDVFGPAVNVASRVQQLAAAGDVFLTETTFGLLNAIEVTALEVGSFELKGVAAPVRVYRAVPARDVPGNPIAGVVAS
jgi:class 3 adenylate cyclase